MSWDTPTGGIVSITFGTLFGLSPQIGLVPPGSQTPKVYWPGVGVKPRTGGLPEPWPVSATVKTHPEAGVPNVDCGRISVAVPGELPT